MARPTKWRKIDFIPIVSHFIPTEEPVQSQGVENRLKLEELEAIRLKDLEGLDQEECAKRMEISRPTFQRILLSAREKVTDCLINGKSLRIEGGNFTRHICPVWCQACGKEWNDSYENLENMEKNSYICPICGSTHILCKRNGKGKSCDKKCCKKNNPSR